MYNPGIFKRFSGKGRKKQRENEIAVNQYWRERMGRAVSISPTE
jgi:hypothetical protein